MRKNDKIMEYDNMDENMLRRQLNPDDTPIVCSACGGRLAYRSRGEYVCQACGAVELDDFGKVNQYLEANGPSSAPAIAAGTGVPMSKINQYLQDGRMEIRRTMPGTGWKNSEEAMHLPGKERRY